MWVPLFKFVFYFSIIDVHVFHVLWHACMRSGGIPLVLRISCISCIQIERRLYFENIELYELFKRNAPLCSSVGLLNCVCSMLLGIPEKASGPACVRLECPLVFQSRLMESRVFSSDALLCVRIIKVQMGFFLCFRVGGGGNWTACVQLGYPFVFLESQEGKWDDSLCIPHCANEL